MIGGSKWRDAEIEDIRRGSCEFAVYQDGYMMFLLYRFGKSFVWSDVSYAWHLVPEEQRDLPLSPQEMSKQTRAVLSIVLIESTNGIVKAIRLTSLSPDLTKILHGAILYQAREAALPSNYDLLFSNIYRRYPESVLMLPDCLERCEGGS